MAFTIRNKIRAEIEERSYILQHLITEIPKLHSEYIQKIETVMHLDAVETAQIQSEGDQEIFDSILQSNKVYMSAMDEYSCLINQEFYRSMFISICAFYENILNKICVAEGIKAQHKQSKFVCICNEKSVVLADEIKQSLFIIDNAIFVRNKLVHDGSGTLKEEEIKRVIEFAELYGEIRMEDKYIIIGGSICLEDILQKVNNVLIELCNHLGYRHRLSTEM